MAVLQFCHLLNELWLIVGALGVGLAYCFALPATSILIPAFIPERGNSEETQREVRAAMALDSASYNIGRFTAPLLAVLVVTNIGFGWAFALNAVSFVVMAAVLGRTRPYSRARPNGQVRIMDGFHMVRRDRRIQLLLLIVATVTISADPVLVLGPALANHFGMTEDWAGYFLSALGFGTILGSFVPVKPPSRVRHAAYPLFLLGAASVIFTLGLNRWLSLLAALVAGIACLLTGAVARSLLFAFVKPERRAAVMAVWAVAWAGSKPLASLVDGLLATYLAVWVSQVWTSTWAAGLPSVRVTGILFALPALIPALAVMFFGKSGPVNAAESPQPVPV